MSGQPSETEVQTLNRGAIVGLVVSFFIAAAGMFALPGLRAAGFTSRVAFWLLIGIEFAAAVGVAVSVRALYR